MIVARKLLFCAVLTLCASFAAGGTVSVTTAADSGPGSLRQAILDADSGACSAPCSIQYGSAGTLTIAPLTPLPDITAFAVTIGPTLPNQGSTLEISGANVQGGSGLHVRGGNATITGVIVNGFVGSGIVLDHCDGCRLFYDTLGLDNSGQRAVPNRQNGVTIIGGSQIVIDSCKISGNAGNGVYAVGATDLHVALSAVGSLAVGNGATGVFLQDVQRAQFAGNTIAGNGIDGIATAGLSAGIKMEDLSLPTLVYGNALMPIDIGFDGVTQQGSPVLRTADISNGFMRVVGSTDVPATIHIFAGDRVNQFGVADAKAQLYAAKADAGAFEFRFHLPADVTGQWISATATTDATSELSEPLQAIANNQDYTVTNANDSGPGSLRQAILDANNGICSENFPCRIQFAAAMRVSPSTPLPPITRSGITIGGRVIDVEIDGTLTISAANGPLVNDSITNLRITNADGPGILIDATANSILNPVIANNTIVNNRGDGILVRGNVPFVQPGTFSSGNRIVMNAINGNGGDGVKLEGGFFELDSNTISANQIGVEIASGAQAHLEGNTIDFNRDVGLSIAATTPQAFKASIGNSIHSNAGAAIRQTPTVQNPPQLTSAIYDPATNTATINGSFTPAGIQYWTTVIDVYGSPYPEVGGRGSGVRPLLSAANASGSFTVAIKQDLRGMRVSATATPFIYQGFKTTPDLFGQGFEYGTTSEFSKAIPVVTTGCPADVPQIQSSGLPLRWSTVIGATSYNVWLRTVPGTPQFVATTSGTIFNPNLPAGTYELFVEAMFPQCPPMKSDAVRVTVGRQRAVGH